MERRGADTGGGVDTSAKAKAWQAVRRALGRLVSHVGVRTVEDAERTIPAAVLRSELALPPPRLSAGNAWKPAAAVQLAAVPAAGTGLRESDLLPSVTLAQGDSALAAPRILAMPIAGAETSRLKHCVLEWPAEVTALPESFIRLPSSPVQIGTPALLPPPQTTPLRGWTLAKPSVKTLRVPRPADPRVRWGGDSVLRRMPLVRRSKEIGSGLAERRRLAETVQLSAEEVALLGVYPDVPILAVERIVVEDEGRQLRLWLKPEVLRGRSGSHRITLLVGRQISTGKMLQAAL